MGGEGFLLLIVGVLLWMGSYGWEMNGMTYTGDRYCPTVKMGSNVANTSLAQLSSVVGANWVAIVVTWYQWNVTSKEVFPLYDENSVNDTECHYYEFVSERPDAVRKAIQRAHMLGLKVMLKPHVDLLQNHLPCGRYWRGEIGGEFSSHEWDSWFSSYSTYLLSYASMAQEEKVEMFSMNCELYVANEQEAHWRTLVKKTRQVYSGLLTAAANWSPFPSSVKWWDVLDSIGVDAYFPLKGTTVPSLVDEWKPIIAQLEQLSTQLGKAVVFTELGYPSGTGLRDDHPTEADYELQAVQYEAVIEATTNQTFFKGTFWWNWETEAGYAPGDSCFTPQWKPSSQVLSKYYNGTGISSPPKSIVATCYGYGRCTS